MAGVYGKGNRSKVTPLGKWSETARVSLDLFRTTVTVYVADKEHNNVNSGEEGPEIMIGMSRQGELMYLNLSSLTHVELTAVRETFNIAFANAEPICIERDCIAKEALENGDDSFTRVYRRIPEIIIREGQKWAHYPRIRRGCEWVGNLVPEFRTHVQNLRGSSGSVSESDSAESGT